MRGRRFRGGPPDGGYLAATHGKDPYAPDEAQGSTTARQTAKSQPEGVVQRLAGDLHDRAVRRNGSATEDRQIDGLASPPPLPL